MASNTTNGDIARNRGGSSSARTESGPLRGSGRRVRPGRPQRRREPVVVPMPVERGLPAIALGFERVVSRAQQAEVLHGVLAAAGPGHAAVVELQASRRRAAPARLVDEAAAAAVARVHRAPHRGRNVARRRGFRGRGAPSALPGLSREAEAPRLEPLELLGDGLVDQLREAGAGRSAFRRSSFARSSPLAVNCTRCLEGASGATVTRRRAASGLRS